MEIPQTVEEANRQGYQTENKTLEQAREIMATGSGGALESVRPQRDCSTIPPNQLCWEGDCDASGWKEVLYCDGTQGCTVYAKVRCQR
jgi:hypothetical protein